MFFRVLIVLSAALVMPARGQAQLVTIPGGKSGDAFGHAVAVNGTRAIVGAWQEDNACPANQACNSGGAYIFEYDEAQGWTVIAHIVPDDDSAGDNFGYAVAINGDLAVVGSPGSGLGGAVYTFVRDDVLGWVQESRISFASEKAGDEYGSSIALELPHLVVGAYGNDLRADRAGLGFVYQRHASGQWVQVDLLSAADSDVRDNFGVAVAMRDGLIAVSAPGDDDAGPETGSVYLYEPDLAGGWSQSGKVSSAGSVEQTSCPTSLAVAGGVVVAGKHGQVIVAADSGSVWTLDEPIEPDLADTSFGCSVAAAGQVLSVGAHTSSTASPNGGDVVVHVFDSTAWVASRSLAPDSLGDGDEFGKRVSTDGSWVVVGAPGNDDVATNAGAAYFFDLEATVLLARPTLLSPVDGSTEVALSPGLMWTAVTGAGEYQLQVADNAGMNTPVIDETGLATTVFVVSPLAPNTSYFWRVRGSNADGDGGWSTQSSFRTTAFALAAPELLAPDNGATDVELTPRLRWEAAAGASSYRVQMSGNGSFISTVLDTTGVLADSLDISRLDPVQQYYWRVRSANVDATSEWSTAYSFSTRTNVSLESIVTDDLFVGRPYPNPARQTTVVPIRLSRASKLTVTVYDVSGRVVSSVPAGLSAAGEHLVAVDLTAVGTGVYAFEVRAGLESSRGTFVVAR